MKTILSTVVAPMLILCSCTGGIRTPRDYTLGVVNVSRVELNEVCVSVSKGATWDTGILIHGANAMYLFYNLPLSDEVRVSYVETRNGRKREAVTPMPTPPEGGFKILLVRIAPKGRILVQFFKNYDECWEIGFKE